MLLNGEQRFAEENLANAKQRPQQSSIEMYMQVVNLEPI